MLGVPDPVTDYAPTHLEHVSLKHTAAGASASLAEPETDGRLAPSVDIAEMIFVPPVAVFASVPRSV